ncbi:MAG: hypothetical protein NC231_03100 [Bacillus sp. (in: Bacteria)]|nr:hypothetical protein [Bacillus sp. (in: firmicutes)]MCM1426061.1 hypothetical protein [Eubacterium sp.]
MQRKADERERQNKMEHILSELFVRCKEADMVLVGIGEEFQYNWDILLQNKRYQEIEREIADREEYRWIVPFLQKMALEEYRDDRLYHAYENLKTIIEGKNYFILSIAMDDCVYQHGLKEERIVTPCGGFRKMQCDANCSKELFEVDDGIYQKVKSYFNKEADLSELREPKCDRCGQNKRFNQIGVSNYAQEGYLSHWEVYTKWLQDTVNKKLCVIELGAGMELPSIIRWPFEKIVYYNQKSFLYRVHPSLYQLGENMSGRGIGIKEKSVNFLVNGFVK